MTSCILNAIVPKPNMMRKRLTCGIAINVFHDSENAGRAILGWVLWGWRTSCFHKAIKFNSKVTEAAPWITCTNCTCVNGFSSKLNTIPLTTMPTKSITYIMATTRGRFFGSAKSVAKANPAVWVVCIPAPTSRKATALAM